MLYPHISCTHPCITRSASPLERSPSENSSHRGVSLRSVSTWTITGLGPTGCSPDASPSGQYFLMIAFWPEWACM